MIVYLRFLSLWEQQRLHTDLQHPQKVHTPCLALEKPVNEILNKELIEATKTTVAKTCLKKWISAVLNFIALIPSRSIWQMLANSSGVEF